MKRGTWAIASLLCTAGMLGVTGANVARAAAVEAPRAQVLVLGTFHMANPGRDIFNAQVDDMLSPARQQQIAELVEVLQRFRPTKVAIEAEANSERVARNYAAYLAGSYSLSRNEIDQIGYRMAKTMGHAKVYPIDVDGDFPMPHVINVAKATGRASELDALMQATGERVKAQNAFLASHTVLQSLRAMNADESVAADMGSYYKLAQFGDGGDWAGADLIAEWQRRNLRIFSNLLHVIDSPNDRVLVVYGAGHLGWLQQAVAAYPTLRLRKLAEFAAP